MDPKCLLLETSGRVGRVGVAQGETLLAEHALDAARRHARDLAPTVAKLLTAQGWRPADLNLVAVSLGPGSYTGLRVGLMSAKALAYATGAALVGIETFAILAEQAPREAVSLHTIADAQQDKVYTQQMLGPERTPVAPLSIVSVADWILSLKAEDTVTGPALRLHQPRLPDNVTALNEDLWDPQLESLLRLALRRFHAGSTDDVMMLEPLYLRPSSAEETWNRKGKP